MSERCPNCGGRGWLVVPDSGNGSALPCPCQTSSLEAQLDRAGVWPRYRACTREAWRGAWPDGLLAAWRKSAWTLTVYGPTGCGKTHLATALLVEELQAGKRAMWREVSELVGELRQALSEEHRHDRILAGLKAPDMLLLDDLGAQHETDWSDSMLSHVLRLRDGHALPTLVTCNVASLAELDRVEPRLASRLGGAVAIRLEGADRRTMAVSR